MIRFRNLIIIISLFLCLIIVNTEIKAENSDNSNLNLSEAIKVALSDNLDFNLSKRSWLLSKSHYEQLGDLQAKLNFTSRVMEYKQGKVFGPRGIIDTSLNSQDLDIAFRLSTQAGENRGVLKLKTKDLALDLTANLNDLQASEGSITLTKHLLQRPAVTELRNRLDYLKAKNSFLNAENNLIISTLDAYIDYLSAEKRIKIVTFNLQELENERNKLLAEVKLGKKASRDLEILEENIFLAERELEAAEFSLNRNLLSLGNILAKNLLTEDISPVWQLQLNIDSEYLDYDLKQAILLAYDYRFDYEIAVIEEELSLDALANVQKQKDWQLSFSTYYEWEDEVDYGAWIQTSKSFYDPSQKRELEQREIAFQRNKQALVLRELSIAHEIEDRFRARENNLFNYERLKLELSRHLERIEVLKEDYVNGLIHKSQLEKAEFDLELKKIDLALADYAIFRSHLLLLRSLGLRLKDFI